MVAHVVLITLGYAATTPKGLWGTIVDFVLNYPGMLLAVAGTVALCAVVATSMRAARRRLRYESWHLIHLYAYLGVGPGAAAPAVDRAGVPHLAGRHRLLVDACMPPRSPACSSGGSACRSTAACGTASWSPTSGPRAPASPR